ncbi:MAG: hypothetical protein IKO72_01885 [Kiritimatiellae bacterium]|nr:hypothetical protein [Kiritimatiellia bacterium]
MKGLLAFFTSNWGLKILALLLALIVYYSLKDSSRMARGPASPSFLKGGENVGK